MQIHNQNIEMLGAIIQYHRKKAGLSRVGLATLADVGKTAIYDVEHGKSTVRLDTLMRILAALNISLGLDSPLMGLFKGTQDARS